ncbi:MAG: cyclic nucleotide-binding domain-containing protein [Myxococcota bacterium]
MQIMSWGRTDVGRTRQNNEDSYLKDASRGIFLVADGMGGHAAGEVASQTAAEVVHRVLSENQALYENLEPNSPPADWDALIALIENAFQQASETVANMAAMDPEKAGMGTTMTMLLTVGSKGLMAHVGDSRLYLVRDGKLYQLSEDHSYVGEMIRKGRMTEAEGRMSPFANLLTRAVGLQPQVQVDTLLFDMLPGDTYLMSSDGLHDAFDDPEEMLPILTQEDGAGIVRTLIESANEKYGKDNISAVVVRVSGTAEEHEDVSLQFQALQQTYLFRYVTYEEMLRVVAVIQFHDAVPGEVLFNEGEIGSELYILLSGSVIISKEGRLLRELGQGGHFGEMAIVDRAPRSATAIVQEPSRLMILTSEGLYAVIRNEPRIAVKMLWGLSEVLSARLRENSELLTRVWNQLDDALRSNFNFSMKDPE